MGFIFYTSTKKDHNSTSFSFKNAIDLIGTAFLKACYYRNVSKILTPKKIAKKLRKISYTLSQLF